MKIIHYGNIVIAHLPGIIVDELQMDHLTRGMEYHKLDVVWPLEPNYQRQFGYFECNLVYLLGPDTNAAHGFCIAFTKQVWSKIHTLDTSSKDFIQQCYKQLAGMNLKYGLVCNAIVYAGT